MQYIYNLGRVISVPTKHIRKSGGTYNTVYIELFGKMRVSAYAGTQTTHIGMYVCVKITPGHNGQTMYTVMPLDDGAKDMIFDAASYLADDCEIPCNDDCTYETTSDADDDEDLLPF